ncbi:AbrB/MazE/SpoVT family DNA-binding domain-containing protein [Chloroflexota bacterium]
MKGKENLYKPKVFGSTVVSPRGQVVIPVSARRELDINSGDTLIVCGPPHGQGLLFFKVEAVEKMLGLMSEELSNFERLVKGYKSQEVASGKERAN